MLSEGKLKQSLRDGLTRLSAIEAGANNAAEANLIAMCCILMPNRFARAFLR